MKINTSKPYQPNVTFGNQNRPSKYRRPKEKKRERKEREEKRERRKERGGGEREKKHLVDNNLWQLIHRDQLIP